MRTIFISIPSYRDSECYWTIKDCFKQAKYPERIFIGLCVQSSKSDNDMINNPSKDYSAQTRILKFDTSNSKGVCWARNKIQTLFRGEDYYLQLDSHMRFIPDWDEKLINMYEKCESEKPILSTYVPAYTPPNTLSNEWFTVMYASHFNHDDVLEFKTHMRKIVDAPKTPIKQYMISGHFLFANSNIIQEVPYDPYIYFTGEEVTYGVRAWTAGWDIFAPNDVIVYHYYGDRLRHWDDHSDWWKINNISKDRIHNILGMKNFPKGLLKDIEKYGLGTARTLANFEIESNISFKNKVISNGVV